MLAVSPSCNLAGSEAEMARVGKEGRLEAGKGGDMQGHQREVALQDLMQPGGLPLLVGSSSCLVVVTGGGHGGRSGSRRLRRTRWDIRRQGAFETRHEASHNRGSRLIGR